jgi:hypothetical protein
VKSFLRNAKAAISTASKLGRMEFTEPKPFHGLQVAGAFVTLYWSKIDPGSLVHDAQARLATDHPNAYRIVLVALGAGLRRA